jgi:ubiquinone/menaquinone biosynthesis C-methylase UbiE
VILYTNPNRVFSGRAYDETYRHDPDRFGHTVTFRALDELFAARITLDQPIRAFDLGCGQGQVISYVRNLVREHAPQHLAASAFFGIDISDVAIGQCEQRDPDVNWIVDSFQDFLERGNTTQYEGNFDLVINKGGLTEVRSASDYRDMLLGITRLLRAGGMYLFIQFKQFYQVWSNEHCIDWDTDIFELAEEVLGSVDVIDDDSAYICVFRKRVGHVNADRPTAPKPRRIVFNMNDGSTQSVFVSGDELTTRRLQRLRAQPDRQSFFAFDPPAGAKERDIERHGERVQQARSAFVGGQPCVLLGLGRVRMSDPRAADVYQPLMDSLHQRCNVIVWPGMISTVRHLCKIVPRWSAVRPDMVVLGPGLEDFKIVRAVQQPVVDLDEFRYRLQWVLEMLIAEAGSRVIYLATPPTVDFSDDRNGYDYNVETAEQFVAAAADCCAETGAELIDARQHVTSADRTALGHEIAEAVRGIVTQQGSPACAR